MRMRSMRDYVSTRAGAATCSMGCGAAGTAQFCAHPCVEHAVLAAFLWVVGIGFAIWARVTKKVKK